ncbi:hypothetical protein SADUNF_Sadunf19G0101900 [Salix dunnii]|uniref:Transmembrane protein n=1 Tax=Salix dunnii TaxID=1413687 RepID=A0A835MFL1_9ROSI|nr:hypothetical protein SADUNF_Sadunf19G0101900 [Salix dunnii]
MEIDLDLQKIKSQSCKGKQRNRSMARKYSSWFYLLCFFFLAGLATSLPPLFPGNGSTDSDPKRKAIMAIKA